MNNFDDFVEYKIDDDSTDLQNEMQVYPYSIDFNNIEYEKSILKESDDNIVKFLLYYRIRLKGIISMIFETNLGEEYSAAKECSDLLNTAGYKINHISFNFDFNGDNRPREVRIKNKVLLDKLSIALKKICDDTLQEYPMDHFPLKGGQRDSNISMFRKELRPFMLYLSQSYRTKEECITIIYNYAKQCFSEIISWLDVKELKDKYGVEAIGCKPIDYYFSRDRIKQDIKVSTINKLVIRI